MNRFIDIFVLNHPLHLRGHPLHLRAPPRHSLLLHISICISPDVYSELNTSLSRPSEQIVYDKAPLSAHV